jgi:hypothetical protein
VRRDNMAKYYSPIGNIEVWNEKPEGYYTVEEWQEMHPAPEPTKEEKLAQLVAQYEADKAEILKYYSDAMIHGDTELMAELAGEMTALDEQYATDYEALKEGE